MPQVLKIFKKQMEKKIIVIDGITIEEVRIESLYTFLTNLGFSDINYSPIGQGRHLSHYRRYNGYKERVYYRLYNTSIDEKFEDVDIAKFSDPFDYMSLKAYTIPYEELQQSIRQGFFAATSPDAIDLSKRVEKYKGFLAKIYLQQYLICQKS